MNKHECSECGTEYLLCANCERIRRFDGTAPYMPTQSAAARLERVVERFERLLAAIYSDGIPVDERLSFGHLWYVAERAEAFIETKRGER